MKKLWIAVVVVATFGSIYPFDFHASELDVGTLGEFLRSCCTMPSRGDVLGNVILFIPVGFIGVLATRPENSIRRRFLSVCIVGALVALALQLMQMKHWPLHIGSPILYWSDLHMCWEGKICES